MKKLRMKEIIKKVAILILIGIVAISTVPSTELGNKEFWLWLTIILLVTIIIANIFFGEKQFELFDRICIENFKKAPIFGVLFIPLVISILGLIYTGMKYFILSNIIK